MKKSAGFSLTEMVVVIAVILILAAVVIPNLYQTLLDYRILNDARGIAAQLSMARMRAASNGEPVLLNFNTGGNSYQMERCTSSPASVCYVARGTYLTEGGVQYLSQNVSFGSGAASAPAGFSLTQSTLIRFNSRGISVDGSGNPIGTAVIYITNTQGVVCAVTVSLGGQPTAQKYEGSAWKAL